MCERRHDAVTKLDRVDGQWRGVSGECAPPIFAARGKVRAIFFEGSPPDTSPRGRGESGSRALFSARHRSRTPARRARGSESALKRLEPTQTPAESRLTSTSGRRGEKRRLAGCVASKPQRRSPHRPARRTQTRGAPMPDEPTTDDLPSLNLGTVCPVRRALQDPHPQRPRPRPGRQGWAYGAGARPPARAGLRIAAPALPRLHDGGIKLAGRLVERVR